MIHIQDHEMSEHSGAHPYPPDRPGESDAFEYWFRYDPWVWVCQVQKEPHIGVPGAWVLREEIFRGV